MESYKTQSSALRRILELVLPGKSLLYSKKSTGLSTELEY